MSDSYNFQVIGRISACFKEKFGIPRQPGLVRVPARIEMLPAYSTPEAFRGLQAFSHIWISFVFHRAPDERWKPTVRPPRLGGNERVGVFASRSMFRPNRLGLSVVELTSIRQTESGTVLDIMGGDFLDGTPVLDIKPYLPYVDAIPQARGGYASQAPAASLKVRFADHLAAFFEHHAGAFPELERTLKEILQYDPRPAYKSSDAAREYSMRLYDFDVKWHVHEDTVWVSDVVELQHTDTGSG